MAASIGPGVRIGLARGGALGDEHELAVAGADRVDGDERLAGLGAGGVGRAHEHQRDGAQGLGLDGGDGLADHAADDHRRIVGTRAQRVHPRVTTLGRVSWPAGTLVLPSILSADFGAFRSQVVELLDAGARAFHVDVMDGHFVPVITFGPRVVSSFADLVHERGGTIDVHLMIEQPERQLRRVREGRRRLVHGARRDLPAPAPHARADPRARHDAPASRSTPPRRSRRCARRRARPTCCSACRSTRAGAARSSSRPRSSGSASCAALLRPGMGLEVDGGVAPATIARCHAAGANLMVAGSAIYDQPSPGEAWQALVALVAGA